jgi:hypothetical protein
MDCKMIGRDFHVSVTMVLLVLLIGFFIHIHVQAGEMISPVYQSEDWEDEWEEEWDDEWEEDEETSYFLFRYNRVEGLFLGVGIEKEGIRKQQRSIPMPYGFAGYSFGAKEFEYQTGLEMGFFHTYRFSVGGEYHHMIDSQDRWFMPNLENSLAAIFIREDFHDFFLQEGYSIYLHQKIGEPLEFDMAYHRDEYESLEKNVKWSLFGGKKKFRENPTMPAIETRSLSIRGVLDSRNSLKNTKRGWYVQVEGEYAGRSLGGDVDFGRLLLDVRRYQPLGYGNGFDMRLRLGVSHGDLPWQKSYHLGGIGTLRGFPFKAFPFGPMQAGGNRMLLTQFEYRLGQEDLYETINMGILENFNFVIFTDIGWVDIVDSNLGLFDGFNNLSFSNLKNSVGLALTNRSGTVRFEIARRTDTGHKPYSFYFRINRTF